MDATNNNKAFLGAFLCSLCINHSARDHCTHVTDNLSLTCEWPYDTWSIFPPVHRDESNREAKSWNRQSASRCTYFFLNDHILGSPSASEQQVDYKWKHSDSRSDSVVPIKVNGICMGNNWLHHYKYNFDLYVRTRDCTCYQKLYWNYENMT